jgi:hypothetical protein
LQHHQQHLHQFGSLLHGSYHLVVAHGVACVAAAAAAGCLHATQARSL